MSQFATEMFNRLDALMTEPQYAGDNIQLWFELCESEMDSAQEAGHISYEDYMELERELGF